MNKPTWLEKIAPHQYQQHCICKPDDKQFVSELLSDGFVLKEGSVDEYIYIPFTVDHLQLEFGMALAEAFSSMSEDQLFSREFTLHFMSESQFAMAKRNWLQVPKETVILNYIPEMGIDNFLYIVADNYNDELVKLAEQNRKILDDEHFLKWLKENVVGRFNQIESYLIGFTIPKVCSLDVYNSYVDIVLPLASEYNKWVENFDRWRCSSESIISMLTHDEKICAFASVAWFCDKKVLPILFDILYDQKSDLGVKRIVKAGLNRVCQESVEFSTVINQELSSYLEDVGVSILNRPEATPFLVHEQNQSPPEIEAVKPDHPAAHPVQKPVAVSGKRKSNAGAPKQKWYPEQYEEDEVKSKFLANVWNVLMLDLDKLDYYSSTKNGLSKSKKGSKSFETAKRNLGTAIVLLAAKQIGFTDVDMSDCSAPMVRTFDFVKVSRGTVSQYLKVMNEHFLKLFSRKLTALTEDKKQQILNKLSNDESKLYLTNLVENYSKVVVLFNNAQFLIKECFGLKAEVKNFIVWEEIFSTDKILQNATHFDEKKLRKDTTKDEE